MTPPHIGESVLVHREHYSLGRMTNCGDPATSSLSAEQIEMLNNFTPAAGERHDEGNMAASTADLNEGGLRECSAA
jgi:hypothetical protein